MSQAVTEDPFIIMVINMTLVFAVLIILWGLIEVVHIIDPTKKPKTPAAVPTAAPAPAAPAAPAPQQTGTSPEVIAAITGAVVAMGHSADSVRAISPAESPNWANTGRIHGMQNR